jgi:hypothetical protein
VALKIGTFEMHLHTHFRLPRCADCRKRPASKILIRSVVDPRGMDFGGFYNETKEVCLKCYKKYL